MNIFLLATISANIFTAELEAEDGETSRANLRRKQQFS
jgi:hypothetical protein